MRLALDRIGHAFLGRTVLEGCDLLLANGEIVALVGPSGCGKTTLLQIAAGLIDPLRGRVRRDYRRHAMVFQEPRLMPWLTAGENIAYGLASLDLPRRRRREIAGVHARLVGLEPADLDKYPAELSGGMRQRVAVARALAVEPEVVFFDEPFTAVDVGLRRALQDLVMRMAGDGPSGQGFSGLFVTHDLAEAVRLADRLAILSARARGIVEIRAVPGRRAARGDRDVFEIVQSWSREEAFAELVDGEGRHVP
ncbi:ATP-binding cassette domain-containing protein [Chelatococcus sp. SYSU_G07232]|uniref:ATP-binding cassette domain-containing protein n=1 Tax=Chelatococcus albus TaxID=3047466 RepID=A0ABT7AMT0_9HYPH|nr:ATP-binding cassette domain-containing protein [Chelatococcus sp. SYSU_G07232]MDJ1160267.1 ATP-binding cassette domain-containing protein [Chelatococcus sp. SYSU_G07232]